MADFKILEPQSLMEGVAAELRTRIHSGQLKPGDRLVEWNLASHMGISRAPVREALRQLEFEGLVSSRPRRGYVVRGLSPAELFEIYDLRSLLEPTLARAASQRVNPEQLAAIYAALDRMRAAAAARDVAAVVKADRAFHAAIGVMANRPLTSHIFVMLNDQVRRFTLLMNQSYSDFDSLLAEHEAIVAAIAAGDGERAAAEMTAHLEDARQRLARVIGESERSDEDRET
ncbi:MAG: GntR family transcriptional regulator [Thermomicrobiales bacterium]|nr:GntR family transcriptional regulator [Thermomicrobiales bacterium]